VTNCAVFGCGSCRRTKGIGIWKLPAPKDDAHQKWREDWLNEITKTREIDQDFRERIKNDRVYTCEKHFPPEDVEICKLRCFVLFHVLNTCAHAWLSKGSSASFSLATSCYFTPF